MKWLWFVCCIGPGYAAIDPDLPSPAPMVRSVFPHGAGRGTTTDVELTGENLHEAQTVKFAGRGVEGRIVSAWGSKLKLQVTVAKDAEVGRRDYWLVTPQGNYVGVFDIGSLPEIREKEPNDDVRKAEPLTLPVLVNGILANEDWDHYKVHAAAGETLVFDVSATRHGSRVDADLALLDAKGQELAWVDDTTIFGDPHLEHTFAAAGDYIVRVGSLTGGGDYRLTVGGLPYVRRAMPAGLGVGQTTIVTLRGTHLDSVDAVWIGDRAAVGQIIRKTAKELTVRFRVSSSVKPGRYWLHAAQAGQEIPMTTEFRVSPFTERTVAREPLTTATALPVLPTTVVNGAIQTPKGMHYFRFTANAGDHFTFRSESMKLGYHLDPTLMLLDATGKKLAYADDPGIDERTDEYQIDVDLSYRFEKAGTYYIGIRDAMYRGGEQLVYRLTLERMAPDFMVEIRDPLKSLYQGQQDTLQVRVRRRAGWDTPVDVWVEGLPAGVTVDRQTVAPKNSVVKDTCGVDRTVDGTIVLLPVRVAESVQMGSFPLVVKARGMVDGKAVEHTALIRYANASAGYIYGPMEVQEARVTVARPAGVLLAAPATVSGVLGKPLKVKINLRRFGAAKQKELMLRAVQLPAGLTAAPVTVPAGAKQAELVLAGSSALKDGRFMVEAVADGDVAGRSAPVAVEMQTESSARK